MATIAMACLLLGGAASAAGADAPIPASDLVKPLGGERYQIGKIVVDRKTGQMRLPARVHIVERPLEYFLSTTKGMKEYESLFEADVSGTEFNLACILLGLERDPKLEPFYQFGKQRLLGPRVQISILLPKETSTTRISAEEALFDAGARHPDPTEWVYVGSQINAYDKQFSAQVTGTLIGFVHDPNSVIESAMGLGIGAYGSINGNSAVLPPVGSEVELSITVPDGGANKK